MDRHDIRRAPRYKDREWLHEQYIEQGRRQQDIADGCGVTKSTISHWLSRHGITDGGTYERAECDSCGDHFRYAPALRDGVYCSNACANDQRKRQVTVECTGCGEPFERRASLDTEYCSMACWGKTFESTENSTVVSGTNNARRRWDVMDTDPSSAELATRNTNQGSAGHSTLTIGFQSDSS